MYALGLPVELTDVTFVGCLPSLTTFSPPLLALAARAAAEGVAVSV